MKQIACPHCGTVGAIKAMISHDCEDIRQEPRDAIDWAGLSDSDICRRVCLQAEIGELVECADLEVKLGASLKDPPTTRVELLVGHMGDVSAAARAGSPRRELLDLAAHCLHWLEDIDRKAAL